MNIVLSNLGTLLMILVRQEPQICRVARVDSGKGHLCEI